MIQASLYITVRALYSIRGSTKTVLNNVENRHIAVAVFLNVGKLVTNVVARPTVNCSGAELSSSACTINTKYS